MSYTTDHSSSVLQTHKWRTLANSAPYIIPYIHPHMHILDIGCGPGTISVDFARHVPQGQVTGIEYVPEPLEQARALATSQGIKNITFQVGNIHALGFPDNSFDIVHVHQVLQHIADPVQALREMRRVVKPGGVVAARESAEYVWYPENEGVRAWWALTEKLSALKGCTACPGRFIHVWAREAGFSPDQVKAGAGAWCFSSPEERAYWGGSMEERARDSGLARLAVEAGLATRDDLEGMAEGWREFIGNENGWFSVLNGEIVCRKNYPLQ